MTCDKNPEKIKSMFEDVTPLVPASILQKHPNLTIIYCE